MNRLAHSAQQLFRLADELPMLRAFGNPTERVGTDGRAKWYYM